MLRFEIRFLGMSWVSVGREEGVVCVCFIHKMAGLGAVLKVKSNPLVTSYLNQIVTTYSN